ncbi:hypothetical protein EIM50_08990 [Pseudoxanthomonas sp. SGD-10]|uniref:hypothetical protein n=1 Tax=unclassified Pseudoxanthomonas TaxID=2645906 RepID=UPI000308D509|nr:MULTISPECIES: hypothetical protein [unclassified Pseudoxanthomonas]RRN79392.1 hypothetical protein EIM50_08990 [Pseudoxanthomonas sp. SGD-10]
MSDLTLYPADIAAMSVAQLAALPPEQKAEISRHLDEAIAWLKQYGHRFLGPGSHSVRVIIRARRKCAPSD